MVNGVRGRTHASREGLWNGRSGKEGCACTLTRPSSVLRGVGEFVQHSAEFVRHHIYDDMVQKDIILYRRIPNPHK